MNTTHCAQSFGVVLAQAKCWSCGYATPVAALLLVDYEECWDDEWCAGREVLLLTYIEGINDQALDAWRKVAPWIERMPSRTVGHEYFGNVCVSCNALQGDWHLHEPDAPFFPTSPELEAALQLKWLDVPLTANASGSMASWMERLVEANKQT